MEAIAAKVFELMMSDKASVWLVLTGALTVMCVMVVHSWLVRADPTGIARSLINIRMRRLEDMLSQDFLTEEARTLIKQELRQRTLWKLTRLFNHRLQDLAVLFFERFDVRASYLSQWRTWLSER